MPDGDRIHINADATITNTIADEELYQLVCDTCDQIIDVLKSHCGPYATNALIIQDNAQYNLLDPHYAVFTKDGINIVKAIEFVSPIQQRIQHLIAYVGSRVEALSHDGTTTSMMFFAQMVRSYFGQQLDRVKAMQPNGEVVLFSPLTSHDVVDGLVELLVDLEQTMESNVITVDRLMKDFKLSRLDAVRYITHTQAMVASKGDTEMASALVEILETLPTALYGMFHIGQSGLETDKRFTVLRDDFDFMLTVSANLEDMNFNIFTEYRYEGCDLILSEDDIIKGTTTAEVIINHIHMASQGLMERDLVLITKSIDAGLVAKIRDVNVSQPHKIIIFQPGQAAAYSSKNTMLRAMMATASVYSPSEYTVDSDRPYIIRNAKIHYKNKRLYISNLYEKDGSPFHPSFNDPTRFQPYTDMLKSVSDTLRDFSSGRRRAESAGDRALHDDFVEIYRRMVQTEVRQFQVSGMFHEVLADHDAARDAYGAVLSALEHGFVYDGYLKMYLSYCHGSTVDIKFLGEPTHRIAKTAYDILNTVHVVDAGAAPGLVSDGPKTKDSVLDRKLRSIQSRNRKDRPLASLPYVYYALNREPAQVTKKRIRAYLDAVLSADPSVDLMQEIDLMQPADTYREMIKRCMDLLPRLVSTSRAIIPGTKNSGVKKA